MFSDEALWRGKDFKLSLTLLLCQPHGTNFLPLPEDAVTALEWAIEDLCQGRLAVGARESGGDGVMEHGELVVDDPGIATLSAARANLGRSLVHGGIS